jgi:hypothetical protein
LRQMGFEQARKSDVLQHRSLLFRLWRMSQPEVTTGESIGSGGDAVRWSS